MGKEFKLNMPEELPEKVLLMFDAVAELLQQDIDLSTLTVANITEKAGIGKGTAYDYFDSKEEIIASAMMYKMHIVLDEVRQSLQSKTDFTQSVRCLLQCIDDSVKGKTYIVRFATILMNKSETGKRLRDLMGHKECKQCHPEMLVKALVEKGIAAGELRKDLSVSYMTRIMIAKMLAYAVFLVESKESEEEKMQFRTFLYQGILDEFLIK